MGNTSIDDDGLRRKKTKRSKKSVQFSSEVSMRCLIQYFPQEQARLGGASTDEATESKRRAKALTRLWRSKNNVDGSAEARCSDATYNANAIRKVVRSEIKGESLRGLEHITDASIGRNRRRIKEEAIRAAVVEQREQLISNVLDAFFVNSGGKAIMEDWAMNKVTEIVSAKLLSEAYGSKAQQALAYARRVAQEDAEVAAEILAEDLIEPSKVI